jgi:FdhD protein
MIMSQSVAFEVTAAGAELAIIEGSPRLSRAVCDVLREVQAVDEQGSLETIQIPEERALTIVVDGRARVTLMTLGGAPELMVLGFLISQQLVDGAGSVASIDVDWSDGMARVVSRDTTASVNPESSPIAATGSGQGSVYSRLKRQLASIRMPLSAQSRISRDTLFSILETMRQHDEIHRKAGSVHSCALFHGTQLLVCVEDVGRHNGIDTLIGWMAMRGCPGSNKTLYTTGRLTSEMVLKTAVTGIPIAVSRNGISAMGYDVAKQIGMTLFGRAARQRFLCYVGAERLE